MPAPSPPDHFVLPDLVSHCHSADSPSNAEAVAAASDKWLDGGCPELSPKKRAALYGLKSGILTSHCYPDADDEHLRVVADFLVYLFHLDNISDKMVVSGTEQLADVVMNAHWMPERYAPTNFLGKEQPADEYSAGRMARDYWSRCIADAKPGPQARFKQNLGLFFEAVQLQTIDRDSGLIPDVESYIDIRRDTSGCKPSFDLIEYAMGLDLPEYVVDHPIIKALNQAANDLVTWSNDIFSYNVEQARGDTHNMIPILMTHKKLTLQEAVDYVGNLCKDTIDGFMENEKRVPSWGPEVDREVAIYVKGLRDWIVGSLHWSFMTERYFGGSGAEVKKGRVVKLLPKKQHGR
ncbi:terpenoid synthase [Fomitopsis serialis]|uniref:terpenoid synthase n=1 Tax=Fomitopsis serialis TaxID=139415 RepID=UPI00200756CA|nr:terpenoid synthase [Neoantrodia serialis]KAH9928095.1 terpenoid synthase [Neoantrodia serialis]